MEDTKIIDYKYDLISDLNKLNIDINNVTLESFFKLKRYFDKISLKDYFCNIFINRFIEICKNNSLDIVLSNPNKITHDMYIKIKIKEDYIYFQIIFIHTYSNITFIEFYYCGTSQLDFSPYRSNNINNNLKIIEEGIKFFFKSEFFEKKLTNSIKISFTKKKDGDEYDLEDMDLKANNLANWFYKKIEE